jgi:hypothetical protein
VGLLKWGVFTILLIAFTFSAVEFNDKSSYTELHSGSQVRYHAPKDKTARALLKLKRGAIYHIGPGSYENEIVLDEFPKMRFPRKCFIPSGDIEEGERVIYNGTGQECANLQDGEEYHIRVVGNVDRVALDEIPDMWYPENDFARPHGGWDYGDRMKVTYDPDTLKTDEPQNGAKYHIKSVLSGGDELTLGEFPKTDLQSKYFTPCTTSPWFMRFFHDGNFYEGDEVIYNGSLNVHDPIASKLQKGAIYHARVIGSVDQITLDEVSGSYPPDRFTPDPPISEKIDECSALPCLLAGYATVLWIAVCLIVNFSGNIMAYTLNGRRFGWDFSLNGAELRELVSSLLNVPSHLKRDGG